MWPFRKKRIEVQLTNQAFKRWLRAQRPDLRYFLTLDEDAQEALACLGDAYVQGCVDVGLESASEEMEEQASTLQQLTQMTVNRMESGAPPQAPQSMAGITQRKRQATIARQQAKDSQRRFLGKEADPIEPEEVGT
jgi:hypothetical protein